MATVRGLVIPVISQIRSQQAKHRHAQLSLAATQAA